MNVRNRSFQALYLLLSVALLTRVCLGETQKALPQIQFFGDVYIPERVLEETNSSASNPNIFRHAKNILRESEYNVLNFEGVATRSLVPFLIDKRYLLKMPLSIGRLLQKSNFHVATLANNHSMDFGRSGLFDTMSVLEEAGIRTVGAGETQEDAFAPITLVSRKGEICILSHSRTYPSEFWARDKKAGTAHASFSRIIAEVQNCSTQHAFTFVVFHWGAENHKEAKDYQRQLAHLVIDAGASAVVGHHPHVLQEVESYHGKPIIYSLGNFAFGTKPHYSKQEGMVARFYLGDKKSISKLVLIPLLADNALSQFYPQPIWRSSDDPVPRILQPSIYCNRSNTNFITWSCDLSRSNLSTRNGKFKPETKTREAENKKERRPPNDWRPPKISMR